MVEKVSNYCVATLLNQKCVVYYEKLLRYGSVFRIRFGFEEVFVLNSIETIREAFVKQGDVFSARPTIWLNDYLQVR